jgi:hypothetical protein
MENFNYHLYVPIYTRYIGKPMCRFARKIGKSKLLYLAMADLPASIVLGGYAGFFGGLEAGIAMGVGHEIIVPVLLYRRHIKNVKFRK